MLFTSRLRYALYGVLASASIISLSVQASGPNGVFGDYFINMTQPCALDEAITGFDTSPSTYGQRKCTTFQNIVKTVLGSSTAPDGQALLGFDSTGSPIFGDVIWKKTGTDISYTGGNISVGKLGDTSTICLNGVCTNKIPDAQKGDILYAVRSDINSNQIPTSYGATANDRVNNLFVAAWRSGVQDVGASLGWSAANIASWQSSYTDIDQMRASIRASGSEWGTNLITGYLVPGLKKLGYADYVKNLAGGCVGTPIVMMCTEGYACAYETFQPNKPAFAIISCIAR